MGIKVRDHPVVQILHVRDGVDYSSRLDNIGIFGVQGVRDDPSLVLSGFEVRVGEAKKDFRELVLLEEVGQELHGIGSYARSVLIEAILFILRPQSLESFHDVFCDLSSDFHSCRGIRKVSDGLPALIPIIN